MSQYQGIYFEDLVIGQSAQFSKTVSEADILMFAGVSGDTNPVHLDAEYAATTPFKERIAHGMLSAGLISAVLGTKLPGPGAVYVGQTLKFKAPVKIGDTVVAQAKVIELDPAKKRAVFATTCTVKGKTVVEGEATIMVPGRPVAV